MERSKFPTLRFCRSSILPKTSDWGGYLSAGNSAIGIGLGHHGSGVLFSLSNASERKIYDYPATVGGLTLNGRCEDKFTDDFWRNLFTLQTAVERNVFSYVGSGVLFGFDNLEESVCYDYNSGSVAVFGKEDYGSIIGCTTSLDISGTVSGDAGACLIRVTLGQTATVDSSQPYRIDLPDNSPSNYLDYGFVYNPANLAIDYGLILVTSDLVPFGLFRFDPNVGAADKFTPNWNGSGTIKISGKTEVPLDVGVFGTGSFKKLGGAAETVAFSQETTDLFKVQGSSDIAFRPNWIGQGALFSTSGAGFTESTTFNPPEDTVLFNFAGAGEFNCQIGMDLVFYSLHKLPLNVQYMITLDLEDYLDSILKNAELMITTVVLLLNLDI